MHAGQEFGFGRGLVLVGVQVWQGFRFGRARVSTDGSYVHSCGVELDFHLVNKDVE